MSSYDETDALVPYGVRIPTRPGITLISTPAVPSKSAPLPAPAPTSSGQPQPGAAAPQGSTPATTHGVQPQPALTDTTDVVVAPRGVNMPTRPGLTVIRPPAPPAPPAGNVPQATGPGVQRGAGGAARTDAVAPNDGIFAAILRADRGSTLLPPPPSAALERDRGEPRCEPQRPTDRHRQGLH